MPPPMHEFVYCVASTMILYAQGSREIFQPEKSLERTGNRTRRQASYSLWCEQGAESKKTPHSHVELSSFVPSPCTCTSWQETERLNYGVSEISEKSPSWCSTVLCGDRKEQLGRSFSHPLFV